MSLSTWLESKDFLISFELSDLDFCWYSSLKYDLKTDKILVGQLIVSPFILKYEIFFHLFSEVFYYLSAGEYHRYIVSKFLKKLSFRFGSLATNYIKILITIFKDFPCLIVSIFKPLFVRLFSSCFF